MQKRNKILEILVGQQNKMTKMALIFSFQLFLPLFKTTFAETPSKKSKLNTKDSSHAEMHDKGDYRRISMKVAKDAKSKTQHFAVDKSISKELDEAEGDHSKSNTPLKDELLSEIVGFGTTLQW